jgi:hypothetical protein
MGRISIKVSKLRRHAAEQRVCFLGLAECYHQSKVSLCREQTGFGSFSVNVLRGTESRYLAAFVEEIRAAAIPSTKRVHVVLMTAHGSDDGYTQLCSDRSPFVAADSMLSKLLPVLAADSRVHFHMANVGKGLELVTQRLNTNDAVKQQLGNDPKSWRVSGCVRSVTRFWKYPEDDSSLYIGNPVDHYVFNGLREVDAPPGVVRLATLGWDGTKFALSGHKHL